MHPPRSVVPCRLPLAPRAWVRTLAAAATAGILAGCSGGDGPTEPPPAPPPEAPVIASFQAAPEQIDLGGSTTLTWSTTGATTCSISGGVGGVPCSGNTSVAPASATTYTLTATGAGGNRTASVTVSLRAPTLATLTPGETLPGGSITLSLAGTGFVAGQTQVVVEGEGVTLSEVSVIDAGSLTASGVVSLDAPAGERAVRVTTPAGISGSLPLSILPLPAPAVEEISPAGAAPGSTVSVVVSGSGFIEGATTVSVSGEGVVVAGVQTGSALASPPQAHSGPGAGEGEASPHPLFVGSLQVQLGVAEDAEPGPRELTVSTPGGTSEPVVFAVEAPPAPGIRALGAGSDHTCAVLEADGSTWCMGFGTRGGLGHGAFEHSVNPVQVAGGHAFEKLYGGSLYSCGLTGTGEAWCWGHGGNGRLGTGSTDDSAVPVQVAGGLRFVELAPGSNHTCGITTEGDAWCWGNNTSGQLGDGSATPSPVPVRVSGGHTFVSIATSPAGPHSCGVRPDGVALCWGSGSLGTGAQTNSQSLVPLPVLGGISFASITIGNASSCGLATDGAAWCWGGGGTGRLGNGSTLSSPNPTAVLGGHAYVQIVGSGNGAYCALTTDGRILCWGSGSNYRLGNGSLQDRNVPTPVAAPEDQTFIQVVMGGSHGCGRTSEGAAWCWGFGSLGRLGNGATADQPTPIRVTAGPFGEAGFRAGW